MAGDRKNGGSHHRDRIKSPASTTRVDYPHRRATTSRILTAVVAVLSVMVAMHAVNMMKGTDALHADAEVHVLQALRSFEEEEQPYTEAAPASHQQRSSSGVRLKLKYRACPCLMESSGLCEIPKQDSRRYLQLLQLMEGIEANGVLSNLELDVAKEQLSLFLSTQQSGARPVIGTGVGETPRGGRNGCFEVDMNMDDVDTAAIGELIRVEMKENRNLKAKYGELITRKEEFLELEKWEEYYSPSASVSSSQRAPTPPPKTPLVNGTAANIAASAAGAATIAAAAATAAQRGSPTEKQRAQNESTSLDQAKGEELPLSDEVPGYPPLPRNSSTTQMSQTREQTISSGAVAMDSTVSQDRDALDARNRLEGEGRQSPVETVVQNGGPKRDIPLVLRPGSPASQPGLPPSAPANTNGSKFWALVAVAFM